jgi:hypothetical protein
MVSTGMAKAGCERRPTDGPARPSSAYRLYTCCCLTTTCLLQIFT